MAADQTPETPRPTGAAHTQPPAAEPCAQPDHLFGPCVLPAGHGYWHQDAEGHEWGATPRGVTRG